MDINSLATPIVLLYLLISVGFVLEMLSCKFQTMLRDSMLAKHIITFIFIFSIVVVAGKGTPSENKVFGSTVATNLGVAVVVYVWFVMTTRTPVKWTLSILLLVFVSYILHMVRLDMQREIESGKRKVGDRTLHWVKISESGFVVAAIAATFVGVGVYTYSKRNEYGRKFSPLTFYLGVPKCKEGSGSW
jgi:hypothetical protein